MKRDKLKPILFSIIKRSGPGELCAQFARDIVAGIVVTVVALPLSIALAIASGVGPEQGLYTAIVAGFVIALFGGIPATGAIARTVANVKSGGRTPVAGMVHAVVLLLVLVFLMPYAALIPMPTIAAILLQVAYNMSGWRNVLHVCRTASRGAVAVMLVTLGLTVAFDLVTAIGVGMLITMVLLMKMLSEETEVRGWRYFGDMDSEVTHMRELPRSVRVYEINGLMFFGMTDRLMDISVKGFTRCLIIRMRGVPSLDSSAMKAPEDLCADCAEHGVQLIISHANEQPLRTMERAGFVDRVGREHFRANIDDAIAHARELLGE